MTCPDRQRVAAIGCAPVAGGAFALFAVANAAGWISLPWVWFALPVWLPFLTVAALLSVVVPVAWAWLVLLAAWAAFRSVARRLRRALSFTPRARALKCARLPRFHLENRP